jgi:hypothetical protein
MHKTYKLQVTIELDQLSDSKMPLEVADRISKMIQDEFMAEGENLMGYDGPMVVAETVHVSGRK